MELTAATLPVVYFAAGQVVYTLIERWRDWRFTLAELAAQAGFVLVAVFLLLQTPQVVLRGTSVGGCFLLSILAVRLAVKRHPIEAAPLGRDSQDDIVPLGIIDLCWTAVMAGTLAFVTFACASQPFTDPLPTSGLSTAYYTAIAADARFLLGHTVNGFFALGAVLTACMGILWAGEIWRSNRQGHRRSYGRTTVAAAKMVYAYFWTSLGIFAWIAWPLYQRMVAASVNQQ